MAERKSGPVKPPIIDLEATKVREDGGLKSEKSSLKDRVRAVTSALGSKLDPRKYFSNLSLFPSISAILAGAALGLLLAYGLAAAGLWPQPAPTVIQPDTQADIAALDRRMENLETAIRSPDEGLAEMQADISRIRNDLESQILVQNDTLVQLQNNFDILDSRFQAEQQAGQEVDLSPINDEMANLSTRIDAIAAGASSNEASALAANIADAKAEIKAMANQITQIEADAVKRSMTVSELQTALATLSSAAANRPEPQSQPVASAQIPLALSSYERAISFGKPFAAELASLTLALPELLVPSALADKASIGLASPDQLSRDLSARIPAILAAKPTDANANWQQNLLGRAQALLAIRPSGDIEGNAPEAIVARLEAAIARRDFINADMILRSLPVPMQLAAVESATGIAELALAYSFSEQVRLQALAPPNPTATEQAQ